jgi:hypothetical protein
MSDEVATANIYTGVSEGSGRVKLVTEPALPATCAVCVRSANGAIKFVDFNASLDYYGAIVICEDCIKECMSLLDTIPKQDLLDLSEMYDRLQKELEVAQSELDRYKSFVDALNLVRPDVNSSDVADGNESEVTDETSGNSESADETSVETESDSDGSDSSGGLKNLSIFAD